MAVIFATGYGGVVALMALESVSIFLSSEIITPFSGDLVSTGRLILVLVATSGALGCKIGSAIAYLIGLLGSHISIPPAHRCGFSNS